MFIFAEDRLRLGNLKELSLRSTCTVFAEDRLHLGNLKELSLHSTCAVFATYSMAGERLRQHEKKKTERVQFIIT